jgi:hypothetical protein
MPGRVHSNFLGRLTLGSREYAVLTTVVIKPDPPNDATVEIVCDDSDVRLLLNRATEFYPEALPFIQLGFDNCVV